MKTLQQIKAYKGGESTNFIDGRDRTRLIAFLPVAEWGTIGCTPIKDLDASKHIPLPYNKEEVLKLLEADLAFAFEKALDKKGLSALLMWDVVKMWLWVLDDPLENFHDRNYAQYGLPLFKAVALKYNFNNPIGEDYGNESKYASD